MARYPKARWLPLPGLDNDPVITPVGVILHIDGGGASSLYRLFLENEQPGAPNHGVESTLFVNKAAVWEQYRDTTREADANAAGNSWLSGGHRYGYTSVETQGRDDGTGWTDVQVEELAQFLAWHHEVHGTPLRPCRTPTDPGIGYHRQFAVWNPNGHACPCPERIRQVPAIIQRAKDILSGKDTDMPLTEADAALVADAVWTRYKVHIEGTGLATLQGVLGRIAVDTHATQAKVSPLSPAGIASAVVQALPPEVSAADIAAEVVKALPQGATVTAAEIAAELIRQLKP